MTWLGNYIALRSGNCYIPCLLLYSSCSVKSCEISVQYPEFDFQWLSLLQLVLFPFMTRVSFVASKQETRPPCHLPKGPPVAVSGKSADYQKYLSECPERAVVECVGLYSSYMIHYIYIIYIYVLYVIINFICTLHALYTQDVTCIIYVDM
jgi:hypothetical protein